MTPNITLPDLNTILITPQTGERWSLSITVSEWQQLKKRVDEALIQARVNRASMGAAS